MRSETAGRLMAVIVSGLTGLAWGEGWKTGECAGGREGSTVRYFECRLEQKDGVRLYTYGSMPAPGEKVAIVIERNPYVQEKPVDLPQFAKASAAWLTRGYARIVQHCRGCGLSEGDWIPYANERADGLALLAWVRTLPFYNGEIFLQGASYLSSVHLLYLDTNPPDVKGAFLEVQDSNRYNICFRNGFFKAGLHGGWFLDGYCKKRHDLQRDRSVHFFDFPLGDFSRRYYGKPVAELDDLFAHPREDDPFWRTVPGGSDSYYALDHSTMPVLLTTRWYDLYTGGIFDMWERMSPARRASCAMLVGAYDHGGGYSANNPATPLRFPQGNQHEVCPDLPLQWFDHIRRGTPLTFIRTGEIGYYALYENRWHFASHLTNGPVARTFYLNAGADGLSLSPAAGPASSVGYVYDPQQLAVFPGGCCLNFGGMAIQPAANFRPDVKSFLSRPLAETLNVRGRMRAHVVFQSDCEDTCFYVRLDLVKKGVAYPLRDDITSLCYTTPDYTPGTEKAIDFVFSDHAFQLQPGDILRLDIASSDAAFVPHSNFKGLQSVQRMCKIAHNAILTGRKSFITLFCE